MKNLRSPLSPFAPAFGLLLGLALACGGIGGGGRGGDGLFSSSYSGRDAPAGAEGYAAFDDAYVVPPDSAAIAVTVQVVQGTVVQASSVLTAEIAGVQQAVGAGCTATLVDAAPPTRSAQAAWSASAEVRVDVDLRGLPGVAERRARLEACLAPIEPLLTYDEWKSVGSGTRQVRRSEPMLLVAAPEAHRDALLKRALVGLNWSAAAAGAPQLHPEDVRCVPDGDVVTGSRRLSGVVLTLEVACRVTSGAAPFAAAAAVADD